MFSKKFTQFSHTEKIFIIVLKHFFYIKSLNQLEFAHIKKKLIAKTIMCECNFLTTIFVIDISKYRYPFLNNILFVYTVYIYLMSNFINYKRTNL